MAGTILITGANGSLAIPAAQHLLTMYPGYTALLTVRNASETDVNTNKLRDIVSQHPDAKASIRQLDLADLAAVHDFVATVSTEIKDGKLPHLASIVCNAFYWNLTCDAELTKDGYDKTFQVNHLAHVVLVLRLLDYFKSDGRIVLLGSDSHWPGKGGFEKYPPAIPDNLELLVKPAPDSPPDNFGQGFLRYANSKLAITMWMFELNRHLEKEANLRNITAITFDPGSLADSRALRTNTPQSLVYLARYIVSPLLPLIRFIRPAMRAAAESGRDVIDLAVNKASPGERGFFTLLKKDVTSPDSQDEGKQKQLWVKSAKWAGVTKKNTPLKSALE